MYRSLNPDYIVDTLGALTRRIGERFEGAGLHAVSKELLTIAEESRERASATERPIVWLRVSVGALLLLIIATIVGALGAVQMPSQEVRFLDFIAALDAGLNDVVLIGAAIFFLVTVEIRVKRNRAPDAVNEIESLTTGLSRKIWQKIFILSREAV